MGGDGVVEGGGEFDADVGDALGGEGVEEGQRGRVIVGVGKAAASRRRAGSNQVDWA